MNFDRIPPAWRLPEGVNASLWEYTHTPRLAEEEACRRFVSYQEQQRYLHHV